MKLVEAVEKPVENFVEMHSHAVQEEFGLQLDCVYAARGTVGFSIILSFTLELSVVIVAVFNCSEVLWGIRLRARTVILLLRLPGANMKRSRGSTTPMNDQFQEMAAVPNA